LKDLIHSSLLVTAVRVVGIVLQSLIVIFLARELSISDFGIFALLYAGLGFARMLGPLGTDQVSMRRTAAENDKSDTRLHKLLNTSFVLVIGSSTVIAILLALAIFFAMRWQTEETIVFQTSLFLAISAIPAFALIGLLTFQVRGFNFNVLAQIPDSVALQILFGAGIAILKLTGEIELATAFLVLTIAAWFVAAIYVAIRFWIGVNLSARPTWKVAQALLAESKEVFYALTLTSLSARAPLFLSTPLLGPAVTAIFDIATRFGTLPTITTSAVTATFSPRFAALAKSRDRRTLSRTLSLASALAAAPALLLFAAIGLGAPFLIKAVLPPDYMQAYLPMLVINAALAINASFGVTSSLLFMSGNSHIVRNFSLAQLIVIIALALILGASFGALGLALAVFAGAVVRDLGMAVWTSRQLGIKLPPFGISK